MIWCSFFKSCIQMYVSRDEDFSFFLFLLPFWIKKRRARSGHGGMKVTQWFVGVWFLFFPFSLFHDKSELVPIFSFSLVILCLIKTYFHPGFLAKQASMSFPISFPTKFSFHYKWMSICKRVYCTEQPMEHNSMPNRRSSGQQKWGHDNTWDLVEKEMT